MYYEVEMDNQNTVSIKHITVELSSFEANSDNTAYLVNVGKGYKQVILEGWTNLNHYNYQANPSDTGWGYRTSSTSNYSACVLDYNSETGIAQLNQFTGAGSIANQPVKSGTLRFYVLE